MRQTARIRVTPMHSYSSRSHTRLRAPGVPAAARRFPRGRFKRSKTRRTRARPIIHRARKRRVGPDASFVTRECPRALHLLFPSAFFTIACLRRTNSRDPPKDAPSLSRRGSRSAFPFNHAFLCRVRLIGPLICAQRKRRRAGRAKQYVDIFQKIIATGRELF